MPFDAHKNLAYSTIATAPSPATSGTTISVPTGHGARFPAIAFNATVWPTDAIPTPANSEIVRVTNISGDNLTITRAQETGAGGPSARAIVVGDQIAATITAKSLTDIEALAPSVLNVTTTGNIPLLPIPSGTGDLIIRMDNTAVSTIQGITAGQPGQHLTIIVVNNSNVELTYNDGAAAVGNKIITFVTVGKTVACPGAGIFKLYYDISGRWMLTYHEQGSWITPVFDHLNFTASASMTWTVAAGNIAMFKWRLTGRTLTVAFQMPSTIVGGTPDVALFIQNGAWGGYNATSTGFAIRTAYTNNNGILNESLIEVGSASSLAIVRLDGGSYAGTVYQYGQITFEVA